MEFKFLKEEKNEIELEIPSLTLVEILRVYLNKDSDVTFVAWKREHFTKNPILKIKTKDVDAKKILKNAIKVAVAELDVLAKDFKSLK